MEKLIKLLNKFERETFPEEHEYVRFPDGTDDDGGYWYYEEDPSLGEQEGFNYTSRGDKRNSELNQLLIISKEFGFIKRLIENNKIEWEKCGFENEGLSGNWYDKGIAFVSNYDNDTFVVSEFYSPYLQLLMLLSIQDEPINFLISILK